MPGCASVTPSGSFKTGQKVNPVGFRLGVIRTWESRWYAKGKKFFDNLHEDLKLRDFLKSKLKHAGVAKIEIERADKKLKIIIQTARPGIVIGKKGTGRVFQASYFVVINIY